MDYAAGICPPPQEMGLVGTKNIDEIMASSSSCSSRSLLQERKGIRPHKEKALNCPRCNSTNTKFCYYNNYSLSQPRYFCKTCRRYWTEGGTLRNIPVGGGSRKNKRSIAKKLSDLAAVSNTSKRFDPSSVLPNHEGKDHLNLGMFPIMNQTNLPTFEYDHQNPFSSSSSASSCLPTLDLMRSSGLVTRSLMGSSAPDVQGPNRYTDVDSGFGTNFLRVFSVDGFGGYTNDLQQVTDMNGGQVFAFEDAKPTVSHHLNLNHNRVDVEASGSYWGGILEGAQWPQIPNCEI